VDVRRGTSTGAECVLDLVGLEQSAAQADAIVVGEERLNSQTGQGTVISEIPGPSSDKPVYAVVNSIQPDLGAYAENFAQRRHCFRCPGAGGRRPPGRQPGIRRRRTTPLQTR
jgi:glycerate kinase